VRNGSIPRATAAVSVIGLNVDPGWRRALVAKLYWLLLRVGETPTMARIAPVRGSIDTTAAAGSFGSVSTCVIEAVAAR
jgi:hypothetical protein